MTKPGHESLRRRVDAYYTAKIREHGPTAEGVDWNSAASQRLRFDQLLRVLEPPEGAASVEAGPAGTPSLLDYGCGYGALADHLDERGEPVRYVGYDLSREMLDQARARDPRGTRTFVDSLEGLESCDWAVASGVLNVKLKTPEQTWASYALDVVADLDRCSSRGFAFNALTSWSDPERMIEELWYPNPAELFDHCKRSFSRHVALLHDYGLWEFTILVRKDVA